MDRRCFGCMKVYDDAYEVCPYCGYVHGTPARYAYHLAPGTRLHGKYIVGRVIGSGGFGVTYVAWDALLEQKVAIKEYLPGEFATRAPGQTELTIFSGGKEEQFASGRKKFADEAKRLAKFQDVPEVVSIYDSFEENKTAYLVMEYLEGETLKSYLYSDGINDEGDTRRMGVDETIDAVLPVLRALTKVHAAGIVHRDIAPDNLFMTKDENGKMQMKLIDFGASRFATTRHSKSLTVMIKEGYSAEEQYRSRGEQGPWTDVYSVAATMYKMLTGKTPQDAMERLANDNVKPLRKMGVKISRSMDNAIMNAMNIKAEYRTKDAQTFIDELEAEQVKRHRDVIRVTDIGKWPKWLKVTAGSTAAAVACFAVLLVTGVIHFDIAGWGKSSVPDGMARVPNVINMDMEKASAKVSGNELVFQILDKQYSSEVQADKILAQTTLGGGIVQEEATLGVVVSAGIETVYVPDVMNFMQSDAIAMLEELNLKYEIVEQAGDGAPGSVISQSIEAETGVDSGTVIKLVISTGRGFDTTVDTEIPDVNGMSFADAQKDLLSKSLYIAKTELVYSDDVPEGQIISQTPEGGSWMKQGSTIMVVVSAGQKSTHVPDVQYKTLEEAKTLLEAAGLSCEVLYEDSETVAKGNIVRQDIEAGTEIKRGTSVTIYVSNGNDLADNTLTAEDAVVTLAVQDSYDELVEEKTVDEVAVVETKPQENGNAAEEKQQTAEEPKAEAEEMVVYAAVPTVTGMTSAQAEKVLQSAGLGASSKEEYSSTVEAGYVIRQDVAAGTQLETGTTVGFVVSRGEEYVTVPDVVGAAGSAADSTLSASGLTVSRSEAYSSLVASGNVISQSLTAGSSVKRGASISIVVSKGVEMVTVPNVAGQSSSAAQSSLSSAGLAVSVTKSFNSSVTAECVVSQSISGGTSAAKGTTVSLVVSKGPQAPSGWTTDSSFVSSPYYTTQTKTQYKSQTATTDYKTSTTSNTMSGYTLYDTKQSWSDYGAWSDWSTTAVSASDSRKVETKQETTTVVVGTEYNYSHWKYWYTEKNAWYYTWCQSSYVIKYGGYYVERGWGEELYLNEWKDGAYGKTVGNVVWYNEQTRDKTQDVTTTYYRYCDRSKITTYYFKKTTWGGWSDWSDTAVSSSATRNVKTRTVYKYTAK